MPELQLVRLDHAPALLAFERENRAYFAAVIPDRGDEYFAEFDARHAQLLESQAAEAALHMSWEGHARVDTARIQAARQWRRVPRT